MLALGLEELQLQVEGGICKLPILEMEQLAEHVGLESSEYKGKTKLDMSRIVRDKFEVEMGKTENKIEYLQELWNFISETPLLLEESHRVDENKELVQAKVEYEALRKQFEEMMESCTKAMKEASGETRGHETDIRFGYENKRR